MRIQKKPLEYLYEMTALYHRPPLSLLDAHYVWGLLQGNLRMRSHLGLAGPVLSPRGDLP